MRALAAVLLTGVTLAAMSAFACELHDAMEAATTKTCTQTGEKDGKLEFANCPPAVTDFLNRAVTCQHFAGEINGDKSERDREVQAIMTKNRCGTIAKQRSHLEAKYVKDAGVMATISNTFADYIMEY